jgi:hypothetical protein
MSLETMFAVLYFGIAAIAGLIALLFRVLRMMSKCLQRIEERLTQTNITVNNDSHLSGADILNALHALHETD